MSVQGAFHYATVDVLLTANGITAIHRLLLDTGAYGLVLGSDRAVLHQLSLRALPKVEGLTVAGPTHYRSFRGESIELLSPVLPGRKPVAVHRLLSVDVDFVEHPYTFRRIGVDGLIGTRELRRLRAQIRLNYESGQGFIRTSA